jgi:hypothetical protein
MDEINPKAQVIDPKLLKAERVVAQKALAKHLFNQGFSTKDISIDVGVHESTIRKWFKEEKLPTGVARKLHLKALQKKQALELNPPPAPLVELQPEQQVSPSDKYQQYVALEGIRMMQECLPTLRGPRTVKEFGELDTIIRRNLGLVGKNAAGPGGRLSIDISVLSEKRGSTATATIIDAEPYEEEEDL